MVEQYHEDDKSILSLGTEHDKESVMEGDPKGIALTLSKYTANHLDSHRGQLVINYPEIPEAGKG